MHVAYALLFNNSQLVKAAAFMCCKSAQQVQDFSKFGGAFLGALKHGQIQFDPTEKVFIELADIRAQLHEHYEELFEKHCQDLIVFKERFGNCNVPSLYPQLGNWCSHMRTAYKTIQKGIKTNSNLSQDRIARLEEIGFKWKGDNKTRK